MKKFTLSALVAMVALMSPMGALYAQPDETPAVVAFDAGTPAEADFEPTLAPEEAAASETAPSEENGVAVETSGDAYDPIGTIGEIREAAMGGHWALMVLLSLMLIVGFLRWGVGKFEFLGFFKSKLGGYVLVFATSTGGMLITVLNTGGSLTFATISQAALLGFGAIGGWEAWKDIKSKKKPAEQ